MPSTTTLLQFALASLVLAVVPGPSVVLLLAVGTERGRLAALATTAGLAIGTSTWVVVVAAGLGALLAARPDAITAITVAGGAYLLWLAARARRRPATRPRDGSTAAVPGRARRDLVDGLVVNLLNPSIALFLAALLPGFVDPARSPAWQQVLVLGGVLVLVSTVVNAVWAVLGAALGGRLRRAAGSRVATAAVTGAYASLGLLALWTALR